MNASKRFKIALLAGVVGFLGLEALTDGFSTSGSFAVISTAEARVGRPLTPVSVAGAARRTVRRCAVGVYEC
jgi:hypothetical protein